MILMTTIQAYAAAIAHIIVMDAKSRSVWIGDVDARVIAYSTEIFIDAGGVLAQTPELSILKGMGDIYAGFYGVFGISSIPNSGNESRVSVLKRLVDVTKEYRERVARERADLPHIVMEVVEDSPCPACTLGEDE